MLQEYEYIKTKNIQEKKPAKIDMSVLEFEDKLTKEQIALIFTNWKEINNLTKREKEILTHILLGEKRKDIAQKLFISDNSVRNHTSSVFKKLNVENRTDLFNKAKKYI